MKPGEFLIIQHPVSGRKPDKFYLLNDQLIYLYSLSHLKANWHFMKAYNRIFLNYSVIDGNKQYYKL